MKTGGVHISPESALSGDWECVCGTAMMLLMPSFLVIGGAFTMPDRAEREDEAAQGRDCPEDLLALGRAFADAEMRGDTGFLERALVGDFTAVEPGGSLLTREQWLDRHRSGDPAPRFCAWDEAVARAYGGAAVIVARAAMEERRREREIRGAFRCSLLLLKLDERWRIASLHVSAIA